jgi:hypothetical protein
MEGGYNEVAPEGAYGNTGIGPSSVNLEIL